MIDQPTRGFKRKTIEATIRHKMDDWIKSLPEDMQQEVKDNYIVTGGAIASMLMGHLPNDYDVYFRDTDVAVKVANHYIKALAMDDKVSDIQARAEAGRVRVVIKSAGIAMGDQTDFGEYQYFEMLDPKEMAKYFDKFAKSKKTPYTPAMITSNAISLHGQVQIITRFVGEPLDIHQSYDFIHCTNWYTNDGGLSLNQPALESILAKELKYTGSLYPVCSLFRIKKFIKRGWSITAGEMLKIAWDISKLNLNDHAVLQDQLIGVDAAYFSQLLCLLREKGNVDRAYLVEAINRVFDTDEFDDTTFYNGDGE